MATRGLKLTTLRNFTGDRWCAKCQSTLPFSDFSVNRSSKKGFQTYCKKCMALLQRERKYGLTVSEINEMLDRGCEVCGTHENLCIDHDHETGKVRGTLCDWHNRALGLLNDDPGVVASLLAYRLRFPEGGES